MPIRMSGLQSGLDTETLVSALVSGYTLQKDNMVKAQTKLQWKQDSWKAMNKSIYSFYSGKLSAARLSKTYNAKSASVSDSTKAKVTAGAEAVNGTQTLEIKELASTGYLTGGVVSAKDDKGNSVKADGSTKLSDITGLTSGTITVSAEGKNKDITLTEDMTVNQFVAQLKDAGLNANFDANNQRFFVSSKTSGADHDFSITASDANGLTSLQKMGLFTLNDTETKEYKKWAGYATDTAALDELKQSTYESRKINYKDRAKTYADRYNAAKAVVDAIDADDTWSAGSTIDDKKAKLASLKSSFDADYSSYAKTDDKGNITYDTDKLKEDGKIEEFNARKKEIDALSDTIDKYDKAVKDMDDSKDYVTIGADGKAVADPANAKLKAEVDSENATIKSNSDAAIKSKVDYSVDMLNKIQNGSLTSSKDAARVTGKDATIILNKATYTSNTNNFAINGLTITAEAKTDGEITITTNTDTDAVYDSIKDFFKEYNTLIKSMDEAYNASSSKGYEPLTSDEKEAMTEDEVKEWEKKIKDSLLRKDATLGSASSSMKNLMAQSFEINGKKYSLASFGIKTLGYFDAADNEKGMYHIDGDKDDDVSSGNDDKLRAAIANDPETVISFFSQLATSVYNDLSKKMASSSVSSAYTLYNDKQMTKEYTSYSSKISDKEDEITKWEDYYYKKFSSMESALAKLNQTQSSLAGYFS
ncbi:MAG: flagellar filament capping protein FliD [Lachnospira sp.]|nr:flagellar filament capping protein FliD [Lachnospira sp.]